METEESIMINNKLIAEFMGAKLSTRNGELAVFMIENAAFPEYFRVTKHNKYHEDWSMLMTVISKIGDTYVKFNSLPEMVALHDHTIFAPIEKIWELVCAFIENYNEITQSKSNQ